MEPFIALMRRYVIDYTNSHDQSVCDEIMEPDYVFHMSGVTFRSRDNDYKPAVKRLFEEMPGLCLAIHGFVTNGNRLAMLFSEHGASVPHDDRLSAWGGIGLYKWNGRRLTENYVEQDYLARFDQLETGRPHPLEPLHLDPWFIRALPPNPPAEEIVRSWLHAATFAMPPKRQLTIRGCRIRLRNFASRRSRRRSTISSRPAIGFRFTLHSMANTSAQLTASRRSISAATRLSM